MSNMMAFALEALVAGLLIIAIIFCARLDRRLQRMRLDEADMRKTVADLATATERAERAVALLRAAIDECDDALADRLRSAERQSQQLAEKVKAGSEVMAQISRIVSAGRTGAAA